MKLLIAPDSFKGSLTSEEVCAAISAGVYEFDSNIEIMQIPSSDGGEGFCSSMRNVFGGTVIETEVTYPLGEKGKASFVYNEFSATAYLELAAAVGLHLVKEDERNIMQSSTYGVGELIYEAVMRGAKEIIIGLGGSATNDCGMGMLSALGVKFFDKDGILLSPCAASMGKVTQIDKRGMIDLSGIKIVAACDVKNPLCGKNGAAYMFSKQKGATEEEIILLDDYARSFALATGINPEIQGSGAAGGVGAALLSLIGAEYISGAELLVNSPKFSESLKLADVIITGEGNTDAQTACGKFVSIVAEHAQKYNKHVIVLSGGVSDDIDSLFDVGVSKVFSLSDMGYEKSYCIANASELLRLKAKTILSEI